MIKARKNFNGKKKSNWITAYNSRYRINILKRHTTLNRDSIAASQSPDIAFLKNIPVHVRKKHRNILRDAIFSLFSLSITFTFALSFFSLSSRSTRCQGRDALSRFIFFDDKDMRSTLIFLSRIIPRAKCERCTRIRNASRHPKRLTGYELVNFTHPAALYTHGRHSLSPKKWNGQSMASGWSCYREHNWYIHVTRVRFPLQSHLSKSVAASQRHEKIIPIIIIPKSSFHGKRKSKYV